MNLIEISKKIIIKEVLKHAHSSKHWRVLIMHEETAKIIANLFTHSELFSYELLTIQRIDSIVRDDIPDNPAIYFLNINDNIIRSIINDQKTKKYKRYTIISINELTEKQLSKLNSFKDPEITYKHIKLNFVSFSKNVFLCDFLSLSHIAHSINNYFNIHCIKENDIEDANILESLFNSECIFRSGDLILVDRFYDVFTPLLRFFTFQALLNDFGLMEDNIYTEKSKDFTEDKLWSKIKFMHISQINKVLEIKAIELNEKIRHIQNADTKDLIKMVIEAPKQIQLKEEVSMFLDLLDQCITRFEKNDLNFLSSVEQNISTRREPGGSRYVNGVEDFFKIIKNEKITLLDKVRLFVLIIASGYDFQSREIDILINNGIIEKSDIVIGDKLKNLRSEHIHIKQKNHEFDISRYKPLIYNIIVSFIQKKKGIDFFTITKKKKPTATSLRKSEFVFSSENKSKNKSVLCMYVNGGITYAEIEVVNTLAEQLGIYILLGSQKILNYENFIEDIKNAK